MRKRYLRFLTIVLAGLILVTLFSACKKEEEPTGTTATQQATTTSSGTGAAEETTKEELPLITLTTLTSTNTELDPLIGGDVTKMPINQIREEKLRVRIDPIYTSPEEAETRLQLLIATDETPDIIGNNLDKVYPGGVQKAYEDGVIIRLNEYLDEYAPNYKRALQSNPDFERYAKSDDGSLYAFGMLRDQEIRVFFGPFIREDLLTEAGLDLPETIDEWYEALKAFKDAGIQYPFSCISWFLPYSNAFVGAYGVGFEFFLADDNTYKYGPIEPGFRDFLETWSRWFAEGLIDPDYLALGDQGIFKGKVTSGECGAALGFLSGLNLNAEGQKNDPNFHLVPTKYPALNKGDIPNFGHADPPFTISNYISAKCQHIERAIMYYDWGYSEEGHMYMNFGEEGVTYEMDNGYPRYTDFVMQSPNEKGWTQTQTLMMYVPGSGLAACYQDNRYFEQLRLLTPEQKEGQPLWAQFKKPTPLLPLTFTEEEMEVREKYTEILTYVEEMRDRFITGAEPLSNFDKFAEEVKKMGIEDVLKAYNSALARFNAR